MQFSKQDLGQLENVMRALRSGTYTMQGIEILAFSDCMKWVSKLHKDMSDELTLEERKVVEEATKKAIEIKDSPFLEGPIKSESEPQKLAKKKK